jgi:hypothetical protein
MGRPEPNSAPSGRPAVHRGPRWGNLPASPCPPTAARLASGRSLRDGGARNRTETSRLKVCRPTFGPRPQEECSARASRRPGRRCPPRERTWVELSEPPIPLVARSGRPPSSKRRCLVEVRECRRHGLTEFALYSAGQHVRRRWRCKRCVGEAVTRRLQRVKRTLVEEAGGCCSVCGYDRCILNLHFHHVDPASKSFAISMATGKAIAAYRAEIQKCVLVCANCHGEIEAGLIAVRLTPGL